MIDWHSHILPQIDDGSRNVSESISLVKLLVDQGVETIIATPHYYPNKESVSSFIERREISYKLLEESSTEIFPKILLGSEVQYYPGISKLDDLELLRIESKKILLLEMPLLKWSDYIIREILTISSSKKFTVMLAHIERVLPYQNSNLFFDLAENGVLLQVNASFISDFKTKRKALSLLKSGYVQFIGSDCHNLTFRPPRLDCAYHVIKKKIGESFLNSLNERNKITLLQNKQIIS